MSLSRFLRPWLGLKWAQIYNHRWRNICINHYSFAVILTGMSRYFRFFVQFVISFWPFLHKLHLHIVCLPLHLHIFLLCTHVMNNKKSEWPPPPPHLHSLFSFFFPDGVRQLKVNIPHSGPVLAPLGSSISIPCFVSLSSSPTASSSTPLVPRVKWSVVSNGVETQILVVRGERVKINEAYRDRAALFNYTSSPDDLSLWLRELRHSDSGYYRCEVQQGLDDTSDLVQLRVKGSA